MNLEVRFHPEAEKEVLVSAAWYLERSPVAGQAFLIELDRVVQQILEAPDRWSSAPHGTRRIVFPRFPFSIFYRVSEEVIEIVGVAHHSRRPGYWQLR
jgi:toxin ParE1/3/4